MFCNKKYIIKLKEKNKENKIIIKEKDDKIDKLEKLMMKANIKLDEVLDKLDETTNMLEESKEELELTNEKLDNTDKTLIQVAKKLDIAVEDRVIKTKKSSILEYFIIMYNNNTAIFMNVSKSIIYSIIGLFYKKNKKNKKMKL